MSRLPLWCRGRAMYPGESVNTKSTSSGGTIIREGNSLRKQHRVNLPLQFIYDGQSYKTTDWSVKGLGVKDFDVSVEVGQEIAASVVLP